jgi:hypothetical protein
MSKAKDLNVCNVSISNLRNENAMLHTKIDELNVCKPSTSTVEHVSICMRCRYINVDAESAFIPFVSFGDLDNNTFKGLTSLLSVEQEIQYDEHT